jgi:hypothetical protein
MSKRIYQPPQAVDLTNLSADGQKVKPLGACAQGISPFGACSPNGLSVGTVMDCSTGSGVLTESGCYQGASPAL